MYEGCTEFKWILIFNFGDDKIVGIKLTGKKCATPVLSVPGVYIKKIRNNYFMLHP